MNGLGLRRGGILAVSFAGFAKEEAVGLAVYEETERDVLKGTWTVAGVSGLGYEELYRLN